MRIRHKYILFIVVLHLIFILISLLLLERSKLLFFIAEALILVSIWLSIHLYKAFINPLNLLAHGIESLKNQDFSSKLVKVGQYEMDRLVDVYNRMIDQLRLERVKLHEKHYFLDKLIEATPAGIIILDFDGNVSSINPGAEALIGVKSDSVIGKTVAELPSSIAGELDRLQPGESRIISRSGIQSYRCQKSYFLDRGFQRHFILIEELTAEMLKTEKKAYGKVIRMMSHEINNSIGAINSILQSSLNYRGQLNDSDSVDFENAIKVAIDRNTHLNRFMSNFTEVVRIPAPSREFADLHDLLERVYTLMNSECQKRGISWSWELSDSPFKANIDVQQFEQVLVNIVKNAIEAIDEDGTITVFTGNSPVRHLIVRDNGKGIPPEMEKDIFSPFFSTKKSGQGVGLTLIREVLINHQFDFSLKSIDGHTDFRIEFG